MDENSIIKYRAADGLLVDMSASDFVTALAGGTYVPEEDARVIVARAQARGLNPLAGDAYVVVRKDNQGKPHATLQVSRDYYLRVAAMQPTFDGIEAGVVVAKADGTLEHRQGALVSTNPKVEKLVGGWARVYDKSRSHPSYAEVSMAEYSSGKSMWRDADKGGKPSTMIRKCAVVQALREAYPSKFMQLYDASEMPEADEVPVAVYDEQGTDYEEPDEIEEADNA